MNHQEDTQILEELLRYNRHFWKAKNESEYHGYQAQVQPLPELREQHALQKRVSAYRALTFTVLIESVLVLQPDGVQVQIHT